MTKYYLDGQLVRTSKTHDNYAYALVIELSSGKKIVKACSSTVTGAGRDYNYYKNRGYNTYITPIEKVSA